MIYIKPILDKHNKKASDFINWICDERKNLELEKFKDENIIKIDANHGSGGKIYIVSSVKQFWGYDLLNLQQKTVQAKTQG